MSQSGAGRLLSPMGGQRGAGRDRVDPLQGLDRFIADPIIRVVQRFHQPGDGRGVTDEPQGLGRPPADVDLHVRQYFDQDRNSGDMAADTTSASSAGSLEK